LTRGFAPATSTVKGPPFLTFTVSEPTISSSFTALALKLFVGQTTQSPFAAEAGKIRSVANAAPPRNDFPLLDMDRGLLGARPEIGRRIWYV
jgi:hypothetical protein